MLYGVSFAPWRTIFVIYDIFDKAVQLCRHDKEKIGAWVGKTKYYDS